jgi:hypothetical protein
MVDEDFSIAPTARITGRIASMIHRCIEEEMWQSA